MQPMPPTISCERLFPVLLLDDPMRLDADADVVAGMRQVMMPPVLGQVHDL